MSARADGGFFSPAVGSRRGVVVYPAGLGDFVLPFPQPLVDVTTGFLPVYALTLTEALVAQGWAVIGYPIAVGTGIGNLTQAQAIIADLANDPAGTKGTRFKTNVRRWMDHMTTRINEDFPAGFPTVWFGFSWGAWTALQAILYNPPGSNIVAYGAHHPPLQMNHIATSIMDLTAYSSGTALDIASTALNAINKPGYLGWGTVDNLVDAPDSGDLLTPALYAAASGAGMPVTSNARPTNHLLDATDSAAIVTWFESWQSTYPATL